MTRTSGGIDDDFTPHGPQATLGSALTALPFPYVAQAAGTDWSKLKGQTIVINWPSHPHFDIAKKLVPEFTAATGIKVELDAMQYLRMKDAQVLQMSKPQGDYDVIVYVIMWKTEYVQRNFLTELAPMFANDALAMKDYNKDDIITAYSKGLVSSAVPGAICPVPEPSCTASPMAPNAACCVSEGYLCQAQSGSAQNLRRHAGCRPHGEGKGTGHGRADAARTGRPPGYSGLADAPHPYDGLVIDNKFEPRVSDPAAIKATEVYKEFIDTGPAGGAAFDFGQCMNSFLQGQSAMYCDSISIFGPARDPYKSKVTDTVGYVVHPKAAKYSGELGGFGLAIPKTPPGVTPHLLSFNG